MLLQDILKEYIMGAQFYTDIITGRNAEKKYIEENPTHNMNYIKELKTIINTFTNNEVIKMLNTFKSNNYLNTRNNELCNITDYGIKSKYIIINSKGNKERYVPITPLLKKYD